MDEKRKTTACHRCGKVGHWKGDPACTGKQQANRAQATDDNGADEELFVAVCDDDDVDEDPSLLVTPGLPPLESDLTHSAPEVRFAELALEASAAAPATSYIRAGQS